jgi:nicotinate-nucleotide pyrophosphorylase (carboxylating)
MADSDPYLHPPLHAVRDAVARALAEDLTPIGDLSAALLPRDARAEAEFVVRVAGVLAGTRCATETFRQIDERIEVEWTVAEGTLVDARAVVGRVRGPLSPILTAERTALNFLGHLSGIATRVRALVVVLRNAGGDAAPRLWDTRKTTPGLRALEKAAVRAGGGRNHRGNLSDWVMLKDNHLTEVGITDGVARARDLWPGRTIHVECERPEQVTEAVAAGADAILLDNMSPQLVEECVRLVTDAGLGRRRPLLEISGGVTIENAASYANTGADMISSGSLTNSAPVLDIGLDIRTAEGARAAPGRAGS